MPSLFFISLVITLLIVIPIMYLWRRRQRRSREKQRRGFLQLVGRNTLVGAKPEIPYPSLVSEKGFWDPAMKLEKPLTKRQRTRARRQRQKLREKIAKGYMK